MKIIIDAYQYAHTITGTDRMAKNFLVELQKIDSSNSYTVVCSAEDYITSKVTAPNFRILRPPVIEVVFLRKAIHKLWRILLPTMIRLIRSDVYFTFHNMRLPKKRVAKRMISSNLDLIPLRLDDYKNLDPKLNEQIKLTAVRADAFMSISHFSKRELCSTLGVMDEKVQVIHLAPDPDIVAVSQESGTFERDLPPNFILTIGGSEPRKNVITVVDAFCQLPEEVQRKYPLLIAGGAWHGKRLDRLKKNPNIHTLGFVSDKELISLYNKATLFVFASVYEGFGFTILESMACGTPTLSSNSSSLPEVAGEGAFLFSPLSSKELTALFSEVLSDNKLRAELSRKGKMQSKKFTWELSAKKLHQLLEGK